MPVQDQAVAATGIAVVLDAVDQAQGLGRRLRGSLLVVALPAGFGLLRIDRLQHELAAANEELLPFLHRGTGTV